MVETDVLQKLFRAFPKSHSLLQTSSHEWS